MLYHLFLCGAIDLIFKNVPVRNGGQMGKSRYAMENHSKHTCMNDGGGGKIFAILMHMY